MSFDLINKTIEQNNRTTFIQPNSKRKKKIKKLINKKTPTTYIYGTKKRVNKRNSILHTTIDQLKDIKLL